MVQNQPGWDASYTMGLSKQMKVKLYLCELLCFKCRTVLDVTHYGDFVRRDQIVQKGIKHDTEKQAISEFVPLFQSESKWETILMIMTLICMKMKLQAELIFI